MSRADTPSYAEAGVSLNPFSAEYVQPGEIPYFFSPSFLEQVRLSSPTLYAQAFVESFRYKFPLSTLIGCKTLNEKLADAGIRGQIIGPHGSGKSTLIESFAEYLGLTGFTVIKETLHNNQRSVPRSLSAKLSALPDHFPDTPSKKTLLILDGYEQLSFRNGIRLIRLCSRKNLGLLVTAHSPRLFAGPVLYRTETSCDTLQKIVSYLIGESKFVPGDSLLSDLRGKHKKNTRAILDGLYDWWEKVQSLRIEEKPQKPQ